MNLAPGFAQRLRLGFSRRAIQERGPRVAAASGRAAGACAALAIAGAVSLAAGSGEVAVRSGTPGLVSSDPDVMGVPEARGVAAPTSAAPERLSQTGLYLPGTLQVDPKNLAYVPQYPLWSDGAEKRRYVRLPEGSRIDATDVDDWRFPIGTRLWKEFSFGRRVETRYMELQANGEWTYASYVWNAGGTDAERAGERGARGVQALSGGKGHDVPSAGDCRACHEGRPGRVLGFGALQLSHEPDPLAPHREAAVPGAVDLAELARRGLIDGLPYALLEHAPRIPSRSAVERAALGYLYGNCSGCHNSSGPLASLKLDFDQPVLQLWDESPALATNVGQPSRYQPPGALAALRIAPGRPEHSSVLSRMRSRAAAAQMPPLGTQLADTAGLALIERWISEEL